jgi:hypothetical protein
VQGLSIDFAGTFDLAQWCKLLRDRGWTGHQVARWLGRSEGYVNNLIRILERASIEVLARWKAEQQPGSGKVPICATDWLMQVCVLPHDEQLVELGRRIERLARGHGSRPPPEAATRAGAPPAETGSPADDKRE